MLSRTLFLAAIMLGVTTFSCAGAAIKDSDLCTTPADNSSFYHNTESLTGLCFIFEGVYLRTTKSGVHLVAPVDDMVAVYSVQGTPTCLNRVWGVLEEGDWVSFPGTFAGLVVHEHTTRDYISLPKVYCKEKEKPSWPYREYQPKQSEASRPLLYSHVSTTAAPSAIQKWHWQKKQVSSSMMAEPTSPSSLGTTKDG